MTTVPMNKSKVILIMNNMQIQHLVVVKKVIMVIHQNKMCIHQNKINNNKIIIQMIINNLKNRKINIILESFNRYKINRNNINIMKCMSLEEKRKPNLID